MKLNMFIEAHTRRMSRLKALFIKDSGPEYKTSDLVEMYMNAELELNKPTTEPFPELHPYLLVWSDILIALNEDGKSGLLGPYDLYKGDLDIHLESDLVPNDLKDLVREIKRKFDI